MPSAKWSLIWPAIKILFRSAGETEVENKLPPGLQLVPKRLLAVEEKHLGELLRYGAAALHGVAGVIIPIGGA